MERVEEPARLEVFRRRAPAQAVSAYEAEFPEKGWARVRVGDVHRNTLILNNIPNPEPVRRDRPKPEKAQRRVPTIGRREHRVVDDVPPRVREDRGQGRRARLARAAAPARGGARWGRRALVGVCAFERDLHEGVALALEEAVQRV